MLLVLAVLALVLLALSSGETNASFGTPEFTPVFDIKLCNSLPADFSGPTILGGSGQGCTPTATDTQPGGNPDLGVLMSIPVGHHNAAQDYFVASLADFVVAGDAAVDDGTAMGGVRTTLTLGLLNNACNFTPPPADFIWWDATTTNTGATVMDPTNTPAIAEGTPNRFSALIGAGGDDDAWSQQADSDALVVSRYPYFSNRLFDPDGDGVDGGSIATRPVRPHARYAGLTRVPPGGDWQLFQAFIFAPGDLQAAFSANSNSLTHPFAKLTGGVGGTGDLGYTIVVILNDPTATVSSVSGVSDLCSPLSANAGLLGQVTDITHGPVNRLTAPAGTGVSHFATARTQSQRDADDDGIENGFDTCPYAANTENPYNDNGPDDDAFDSVCDPTPSVNTAGAPHNQLGDHDGDYYHNPQDLCPNNQNIDPGNHDPALSEDGCGAATCGDGQDNGPLCNNAGTDGADGNDPDCQGLGEKDSENTLGRATTAPDGGPKGDAIGDDCDTDDIISDGDYFNVIYVDSICVTSNPGVDDKDNDGWCVNDGDDDPYDGDDPNDNNASVPAATFSLRLPSTGDNDQDDNQSGKLYQLADDSQEWAVGTDPMNDCPLISGHDTWPPDINADGVCNILDIVQLTPPVFNAAPPDPNYIVRKDLNADGVINILDIVQLTPPVFNKNCTQ